MTQEFYHLAPTLLEVGSIIKPGNFGRILEQYPSNGPVAQLHMLVREQTYESVRQEGYTDKPSRYKSIFLFPNLDSAHYLKSHRRLDILYKVKILQPEMPIHFGEMAPVNDETIHSQYLWHLRSMAVNFWGGNGTDEHIEAITESPVEIIELIDK